MGNFGFRISDFGFGKQPQAKRFPKSAIRNPQFEILALVFLVMGLFGSNLFGQAPAGNEKFQQKQYAEAAAAYENVPAGERDAGLLNRLGISYHLLNQLREAEAAYKSAIAKEPTFSEPSNNLAILYYSQRRFSEAERQVRKALERNPESAILRFNLRASRYARENSKKAREVADSVATENPNLIDRGEGDLLQARILMPAKDLETASLYERRGDSFFARKMYEDAIVEYQKSIAIDRYNASTANRLGLVYHQAQKINEAERYYREALKQNPLYFEALNNIGTLEYARKQYSRAMDQYSKALKLRPESATVLLNIGACLFAMERYDEGFQVYDRALAIDPKAFDRSAVSGFGTLIQTSQRNEMMMNFNLAKVFAKNGDKDRAISYLYKAAEEGFKEIQKIKGEPAFASLIEDERYIRLMDSMAAGSQVSAPR